MQLLSKCYPRPDQVDLARLLGDRFDERFDRLALVLLIILLSTQLDPVEDAAWLSAITGGWAVPFCKLEALLLLVDNLEKIYLLFIVFSAIIDCWRARRRRQVKNIDHIIIIDITINIIITKITQHKSWQKIIDLSQQSKWVWILLTIFWASCIFNKAHTTEEGIIPNLLKWIHFSFIHIGIFLKYIDIGMTK